MKGCAVLLGCFFVFLNKLYIYSISKYLTKKYSREIGCNMLKVNGFLRISGVKKCSMGENIHFGGGFIRGEGGLTIGDNTHFSRNLTIYTMSHNYEGERIPYDDTFRYRPVFIGRNVWIGMNVTILPGATILDGAIIGAGSVVAGKVGIGEIFVAPKAVPAFKRDWDHYIFLENKKAYGGVNGGVVR